MAHPHTAPPDGARPVPGRSEWKAQNGWENPDLGLPA